MRVLKSTGIQLEEDASGQLSPRIYVAFEHQCLRSNQPANHPLTLRNEKACH